jgi:hypothetical protein
LSLSNTSVFFVAALLAAPTIRIGYCIFFQKNAVIAPMNIDLKKLNVPWISKDGQLDLLKFPIDSTLSQTMSDDDDVFRNGCRMMNEKIGRYGTTQS